MPSIKSLLMSFTFIYLLVAFVLYYFQRNFLYFPTPPPAQNLNTEIFIPEENISLNVIVLNPGKSNAILYFGGNAEPVEYNAPHFIEAFTDHTVYLVNYRGYGGSSGTPTEKGIFSDALFLYDILARRHERISSIGRSLGSGVSAYLASTRKIDKLGLITPYDSVQSIAQSRFPLFPAVLLVKDKYASIDRVKNIHADVLMILAEQDDVIPASHSLNLADAFPEQQIQVHTLENTHHNNLSERSKFYVLLKAFFT